MVHNANRADQLLSTLVVIIAAIVPVWWLCLQLGHSGWLSLLMLLPLLNVVLLLYWPHRSSWLRPRTQSGDALAATTDPSASTGDRRRRLPSASNQVRRPASYCSRAKTRSLFHTVV